MAKPAAIEHSILNLPDLHGPFHIIGDVHGCFGELVALLQELKYTVTHDDENKRYLVQRPDKSIVIFVGDLVDRGPNSPEVLQLAMDMAEDGLAYCVSGNHDDKLLRLLLGRSVRIRHGLEMTVEQLKGYRKSFKERVKKFLAGLPHHIILDNGRLVVAHAGLEEELHGRNSRGVRDLCLYGPTTGETDEHGLPIRLDWAADYCGKAIVVYGHTPVHEPSWRNNTINIDTGCVFGGRLTALTYPDHTLHSVDSFDTYATSVRPFIRYHQHH
ncbi:protein phosphatase [Pontibacter aydingkolensis]|uniref:Metallophosphoesterase n=1 Tax=Pontibacter aydingkolensis TaxID=1911536 RepID=A0ABS7CXM8_9BACT|nr:metallophosphoesterase [Pontibacter aydingkolensis]MBW7468540.1 metallophosphoesterase [Pontibacter aydingkolensis]